jgi:hypothetical protein
MADTQKSFLDFIYTRKNLITQRLPSRLPNRKEVPKSILLKRQVNQKGPRPAAGDASFIPNNIFFAVIGINSELIVCYLFIVWIQASRQRRAIRPTSFA